MTKVTKSRVNNILFIPSIKGHIPNTLAQKVLFMACFMTELSEK